jgi:MFS family permease
MGELPPPDLMDRGGRMRRLVLALIVGGACATIAHTIMVALIPSEELERPVEYVAHNMSAAGFVVYFTAIAGIGAFIVTFAALNALAKRKWQRERVPAAKRV